MAAVDTARSSPGVVAVSMSWGFSETPNETSYDANFTTPTGHQGITFSPPAEIAVSRRCILPGGLAQRAVGRRDHAALSGSGGYQSESAWTDSGGGYSQYEPEPSYQAESSDPPATRPRPTSPSTATRTPGVQVYVTESTAEAGKTPGLVDDGRRHQPGQSGLGRHHRDRRSGSGARRQGEPGRPHADVAVALRRSLVRLPHGRGRSPHHSEAEEVSATVTATAFWSSSWFGGSGLGANATTTSTSTGANTATGLGSPNGPALVSGLVASTLTTPLTPVTGSGGGTTPSPTPTPPTKPVGGGSGHHHRPTHPGSRTVKSGKTHAEAPARSRHVAQDSVRNEAVD